MKATDNDKKIKSESLYFEEKEFFSENSESIIMEQRILTWLENEKIVMMEPEPKFKKIRKKTAETMKLSNSELYQRRIIKSHSSECEPKQRNTFGFERKLL